eukprot:2485386-Pleurochrysis_carterae.AAC.3
MALGPSVRCFLCQVGLREVAPTPEELPFVRAGWFRGARGAVVFELRCVPCGALSRWFRTSEPRVMLRPRWGKLCGEQARPCGNFLRLESRIRSIWLELNRGIRHDCPIEPRAVPDQVGESCQV